MEQKKWNMANTEDGFRCIMRGKYLDAERMYRQAIASSEKNTVALHELAWVYLLQHKYSEMERTLNQLVSICPESLPAYYDLSRVCLLQRKYAQAEQALLRMIELSPDNTVFLYQLGRVYQIQEKHEQAEALFEKLSRLSPEMSFEEEQFFDSLIQLEPVQMHEEGNPALEDPVSSGKRPKSLYESDVTMLDMGLIGIEDYKIPGLQASLPSSEIVVPLGKSKEPEPVVSLEESIFDDVLYKERLLGQGGMGEVFLVKHLEWDKRVAIKRCLHTDNQTIVERFQKECLAWLSLEKHPNVVSAVHFTKWEGKPSLLIEYIEGKTLKEVLRELRITTMIDDVLAKLGKKPALNNVMSLLTFFGGAEERGEITEAWLNIVKESSCLSLEEVKNILKETKSFQEHEIEYLQNRWIVLPELSNRLRLDTSDLLDYSIQICRGMAHAHKHGMLHRDLKLANILIEEEPGGKGILKVTDFGLVKMKEESEERTSLKLAKSAEEKEEGSGPAGTPKYMAPEQWNNISSEKSDIYSFGMILYELLTRGKSPYSSHIEDKTKTGFWWANVPKQNEFYYWSVRHCSQSPIPPSQYAKDIPQELEQIILQCLEKDPQARPQDFFSVANRLLEIYSSLTRQEYPRGENLAPELVAMELNNRAISLLEMEFSQEGHRLLSEALEISPNLVEVQLNASLLELLSNQISLADFFSKTANCFDGSERDVKVLELLFGIFLQYGYSASFILPRIPQLESRFVRDFKLKRIKAKCLYLIGNYQEAQKIFEDLCSLENTRLEDWYHLVGSLYHQKEYERIKSWMGQASPHFKTHACFREIKRLVSQPVSDCSPPRHLWYEVECLENPHSDAEITAILVTSDNQNLVVYYSKLNQTIYQVYHIPDWKVNTFKINLSNTLEKKHIANLKDSIVLLSFDGAIYIQKISQQKNLILRCKLPQYEGYTVQDACVHHNDAVFVSVHHFGNEAGEWISYIAFWKQSTWQQYANIETKSKIIFLAFNENGSIVWMADKNVLYTWGMKKEAPPQGQEYGYCKPLQYNDGRVKEVAEIVGIYYVEPDRLAVLKQIKQVNFQGAAVKGTLHLYLWDVKNGKDHQSAKLERTVLVSHGMVRGKYLLLLVKKEEGNSRHFVLWDLRRWQQSQDIEVARRHKTIEASGDGTFVLFPQSGSFLDVSYDGFMAPEKEDCQVFSLGNGGSSSNSRVYGPALRFGVVKEINHVASTVDSQFLFLVSANKRIKVWMRISQDPFPLLHKLSYLYIKPTSTLQDLDLQKRIQKLLLESDRALNENDPQRALDYLRGIQNFKGYEWDLVMKRIYHMVRLYKWQKIGLRESLKMKKVPWPYRDLVLSPDGEYLLSPQQEAGQLPLIWEVAAVKEIGIQSILDIKDKKGKWVVSQDGSYLLFQTEDQVGLYDLQNKSFQGTVSGIPIKISEAIGSQKGNTVLLKEEGFGSIVILDVPTLKATAGISQSKYHAIQDCCTVEAEGNRILFASECQGGFQWELLEQKEGQWQSKIYHLDFTEQHMFRDGQDDSNEINLIANRSYVIFRGSNFDLINDVQFRHIEVFELRHQVFFSLKEEKFRKAWLSARSIATTPDGSRTFLSLGPGQIGIWHTAGHIKNWKQSGTIKEMVNSVTAMTVTADGKFLICADTVGNIKIVKIDTLDPNADKWEVVDVLKADALIQKLYLSSNDRYLFAVCENALHVWQIDWVWDIEQYIES